MPIFAFRAQQFYDLPSEQVREVFNLGVKVTDIIEKITTKDQIKKYFRKIGYYYMHLKDQE